MKLHLGLVMQFALLILMSRGDNMLKKEDLPKLARKTVEDYVLYGKREKIDERLEKDLKRKAGCFVTLKIDDNLRGCIGTTKGTQKNIAEEVQKNAISAAIHDPRFPEVDSSELEDISYSVDVLGKMEKVDDKSELDPKKYGVLVKGGHQSGLLLPDLEGVDSIEEQLNIARKKAGLLASDDIEIYRFVVRRYEE